MLFLPSNSAVKEEYNIPEIAGHINYVTLLFWCRQMENLFLGGSQLSEPPVKGA